MKINKSKQVQSIVKFGETLKPEQISSLLVGAITEYNRFSMEEWSKKPLLIRWFTSPDIFCCNAAARNYFSFDGKSEMRLAGPYRLDPERYPEAKYEVRYLIGIIGKRDKHLYFNVIPGVAKEYQFGTLIPEDKQVTCITIKANMKSSMYWKRQQAEFLTRFVLILKQEMKKKNYKKDWWFTGPFFYLN